MGIPKFYRWLSERYPLINQKIEDDVRPEFDALYLDMNGIFHQCSHGPTTRSDITIEEMFVAIMKYISYIVSLVKPKRLLYLAVDGVAPRAKQNQQRSRRFRSARDRRADIDRKTREGRRLGTLFDSNCITPGTEFMDRLSMELDLFIRKQMSENGMWKGLSIIYSDHLTPGEGEHKIMAYIRAAKMQPDYDPDTRHCMYGLDADLIMLSLVSHDIHFALLREEVIFGLRQQEQKKRDDQKALRSGEEFQLLHISLVRKFLDIEFGSELSKKLRFDYSVERIIDDFIVICILVGNDFVPHLPTIDIATGGLSKLFNEYRRLLPQLDGYLSEAGVLHLSRMARFLQCLADTERDDLIKQYEHLKTHYSKRYNQKSNDPLVHKPSVSEIKELISQLQIRVTDEEPTAEMDVLAGLTLEEETPSSAASTGDSSNGGLVFKRKTSDGSTEFDIELASDVKSGASAAVDADDDADQSSALIDGGEADSRVDSLLYSISPTFRKEYYEQRWKNTKEDDELMDDLDSGINQICVDYIKSLQWVLLYYFQGCPSWGWYYAHHYAPLVSDLACTVRSLAKESPPSHPSSSSLKKSHPKRKPSLMMQSSFEFDLGEPYLPFQQLLAVLPISSNDFLPLPYRLLMTSKDSPISSLYPSRFRVDMNLATVPWQGIALLPFIPDEQLKIACSMISDMDQLSEDEKRRNVIGCAYEYRFDFIKASGVASSVKGVGSSEMSGPGTSGLSSSEHPSSSRIEGPKSLGRMLDVVSREEFYDPPIPGKLGKFIPRPCEGASQKIEGFPQLDVIEFQSSIQKIGCKIFGSKSKYSTMVCRIIDPLTNPVSQDLLYKRTASSLMAASTASSSSSSSYYSTTKGRKKGGSTKMMYAPKKPNPKGSSSMTSRRRAKTSGLESSEEDDEDSMLDLYHMPEMHSKEEKAWKERLEKTCYDMCLQRSVFVEWPYVRESRIHAVESAWNIYFIGEDGRVRIQEKTDEDYFEFHKKCVELRDELLLTFGVDTGNVNVLVYVRKLIGMRRRLERIAVNADGKPLKGRGPSHPASSGMDGSMHPPLMVIRPRTVKNFSKRVEYWPLQGVVTHRSSMKPLLTDLRFEETTVDLEREFARGMPVMYIGNEYKYFGKFGRVMEPPSIDPECGHVLDIRVINRFDATDFPQRVISDLQSVQNYYNMHETAELSGLSTQLVSRLSGSLIVRNGYDESFDIGLNLKLSRKGKVLPGYCRGIAIPSSSSSSAGGGGSGSFSSSSHGSHGRKHDASDPAAERGVIYKFEFSDRAVRLIRDYTTQFSYLIDLLQSHKGFKFKVEDFAPHDLHDRVMRESEIMKSSADSFESLVKKKKTEYGLKYVIKIKEWLSDQPFSKLPLIDCQSRVLDLQCISELERRGSEYYLQQKSQRIMGLKMQKVPVGHVYSADPSVSWSPTFEKNFKLGDRVSSLRSDQGCPFGTLGTVVGIHDEFIEVLCDRPVVGGTDLHSRCSQHRGLLMQRDWLVNLTRPPKFRQSGDPAPHFHGRRPVHRMRGPRDGGPRGGGGGGGGRYYHPRGGRSGPGTRRGGGGGQRRR